MASVFAGVCATAGIDALGQQQEDAIFSVPDEAARTDVFYFQKATFDPYIGTRFRVIEGKRHTDLTLLAVDESSCAPVNGKYQTKSTDCFILQFEASGKLSNVRTIYEIEHAALGTFYLFVTPRVSEDGGRKIYYEAVINHLK